MTRETGLGAGAVGCTVLQNYGFLLLVPLSCVKDIWKAMKPQSDVAVSWS